MQRDSCLRRIIDPILIRLVCSGLIKKWASNWVDTRYMEEPTQNGHQSLSLEQLEGAFNLLKFGLAAALLVFCVEIFTNSLTKVLKFLKKLF